MNQSYCPCPKCSALRTKVVLTNRSNNGITIRRRRCIVCEHRWYSIQYPEVPVATQEIKWIASGRKAKFEPSTSF